MTTSRRHFLKQASAVGALAAFGFGYSHTAHNMLKGALGEGKPRNNITGNAPAPEFTVDPKTGELKANPDQLVAYTMCMGCTTVCGVRVRIDNKSQQVIRVTGNPYHPLSADPHLPFKTPLTDSFRSLSRYQEAGLSGRSTACGRGNAVLSKLDDPNRVLVPLKRVGPRGSGKWAPISPEKLIEEVVDGGDLFGEGHVDGLRAIRDVKTPIDPNNPEFGPKSNQLAVMPPFKDGRLRFAARFAKQSFGTINFTGHRAYCGMSMRAGYAALLGDWKKQPHLKPDFNNAEFLLFVGTAPANAGNPFKRQGMLLAHARSTGKLKYAVVDPVLTNSVSQASNSRGQWIPIRPNTDAAMMMAMMRWIFENERYDAHFLKQPNLKTAMAAGEASFSNATHLVVTQQGHPHEGRFLRATEMGLAKPRDPATPLPKGKKAPPPVHVVIEAASGKPAAHNKAGAAELFYTGKLTLPDGDTVEVKSSLALLREEANKLSIDDYAEACGVPAKTIKDLAKEFTSYGKHAAADCHGGTMGSNGFYTAYSIVMLNALVGNLNVKGGTSIGGGRFKEIAPGPRYNLKKFAGMVKPKGIGLGLNHYPYQKSHEFARKKANGENPYPSKSPWYPVSTALGSDFITSGLNGYPYSLKALILWSSNPVYGIAGLKNQVVEKLTDPKALPLIVSVDPFINESNTYADYIVPDSVLYESWGWASAWGATLTKVSTARWPVVDPKQVKDANGQTVCMEWFFIQAAKRMGLPGFGDKAIKDKDGTLHPLNSPEDYYLRAAANIAYNGAAVPDVSDDEISLSGVRRIADSLKQTLKADEWRKAAYIYARGGRFDDIDKAYKGETLTRKYKKPMQIYDEAVGISRNTLSGKRYIGTATWVPPSLADGSPLEAAFPASKWPFKVISTKSNLQSSHTIGIASLQEIHPVNPVSMHHKDAAALGISNGDRIRISTPGASVETMVQVREGIHPGTIAIEHGFGHHELGARKHRIGERWLPGSSLAGKGVNINDLGFADPKHEGLNVLSDFVVGSVARQGLPAKIEKI